jgi:dienelactone hydrolase
MKLLHILVWSMCFIISSPLHCQQETDKDHIPLAKAFVETLVSNNFTTAVANFDSTMKRLMPPEKTEDVWKDLIDRLGPFRKQISARQEKYQQYDIIFVTCQFQKTQIDVKIVYNPQKQIAGLFFVPPKTTQEYEAPDYVNKDLFYEIDVSIGEEEWRLPGIISIPKGEGPSPAIVLVHGSGPNDKDETIGPNKPFKDLAWGLASKGIAVLRYDKRTNVHGLKMVSQSLTLTVKEETVDDAVSAVNVLRNDKDIDSQNIFVLGHSLGGMLIPRIGQSDSSIAGFIILAGAARPLEDLIIEQFEYIFSLDGQLTEEEKIKLSETKQTAEKIKHLTSADLDSDTKYIMGASPAYWLDLQGYDPPREAETLQNPIYILQGGRDYQVTIIDYERWKNALAENENVLFKLYPQLNHLFITGQGKSSPSEYQNPGHVDAEVINDIAKWINRCASSDAK